MSFLKSLFGWSGKEAGATKAAKQAEHKGFLIEARPYREGSRFQTAGIIAKDVEGTRREHKFIRADSFATIEEAADFALSKGRQIIDEQGERLFQEAENKGAPPGAP
jgi:hypothetical protein